MNRPRRAPDALLGLFILIRARLVPCQATFTDGFGPVDDFGHFRIGGVAVWSDDVVADRAGLCRRKQTLQAAVLVDEVFLVGRVGGRYLISKSWPVGKICPALNKPASTGVF